MTRRRWKDRMEPEEAADADLRKSIFREMANDFFFDLKHGMITDRPGSIARMLEQAFKAGALAAKADDTFDSKDRLKRPLTEKDVPSLARDALRWFRYALGGGFTFDNFYDPVETLNIGQTGEPFRPEALTLFMRPKIPGFPSTITKDEWFLWMGHSKHTFSNKVVGPLEKAGLLDVSNLNEQGWRMAFINEWGFELLATGRTSFQEDRKPGASSTFASYRELVNCDPNPLELAAKALGLFGEEEDDTPTPGRRK